MSVKVPAKGTHGVPFPRLVARLTNGLALGRFRRGSGREVRGMRTFILETRGAKSGQTRQAIVGYLEEPPDGWLVIASTGGSTWNPGWLHNLAKDPEATIDFGDGRRVDVEAQTLEGADLEAAWDRIEAEAPLYAEYRTKTDRQIPVVRLRTRPSAASDPA
jgi:deazaflavin-dependent oxidoreductase (nitroreductase family)